MSVPPASSLTTGGLLVVLLSVVLLSFVGGGIHVTFSLRRYKGIKFSLMLHTYNLETY